MHQKLVEFNKTLRASRADLPVLQAGDVVKVRRKIKEGDKTRIQMFQGMVIAIKGGQSSSQTVTVRKVSSGIGVEIIFPLLSSQVESIELMKRTKARRGKLYFVRTKSAKVIGKKLKEVPFEIGKAGQDVQDVVKEVQAAATASAEEAPTEAKSE
ncbi:MAG: 50S ribosomal protein L19 [Candidatus Moraniibacteriota bacterium]